MYFLMDSILKLSRLSEGKLPFDLFYSFWNNLQSNKTLFQTCFIPEDIKSDTMKTTLSIENIGK